MRSQFVNLERRTARGGKDSIDHIDGARDDIANSVAGALLAATTKPPQRKIGFGGPCPGGTGIITWHDPEEEERPRLRVVRVNERGEPIKQKETMR